MKIIRRRPEIHMVLDRVDKKLLGNLAEKIVDGFGLPRNYPKGFTRDERRHLCGNTRREKRAMDEVERSEFLSDFGREVTVSDLTAIAVARDEVRRRVENPNAVDRIPREIIDGIRDSLLSAIWIGHAEILNPELHYLGWRWWTV